MNNFFQNITIILLFSFIPATSFAQNTCKVLDPDVANYYEGGCKNGLANGRGKAKGQDTYEGEFFAGNFHGKGIYTWSDGERYKGDYKEGVKHGYGIYTWSNGERYEGEFMNGKKHGKGVLVWPESERNCDNQLCNKKFAGTYENDYRKCGHMDYFNGDSYDGCYEVNKKNERLGDTKFIAAEKNRRHERLGKCQHLYIGRIFSGPGGVFGIKQGYEVMGFSPQTGQATIKSSGSDYRQEVSCSSIPE